jgi:hypothetical protein
MGSRPEHEENRQMLPDDLIAQFWNEVERLLVQEHHVTPTAAQQGVAEYWGRVKLRGVGDIFYHQDARDVAKTIAGFLAQGGFAAVFGAAVNP